MRSSLTLALTIAMSGCTNGGLLVHPTGPQDSVTVSPGSLTGGGFFPADNPWNRDVSADAMDPNSPSLVATCGSSAPLHPDFGTSYQGSPIGMPYIVVRGTQAKVPVSFQYSSESDPGPYPVPPDAPIEGGSSSTGDRHVLIVDSDNWKLYELYDAHPINGGSRWTAASGAIFDLNSPSTCRLDVGRRRRSSDSPGTCPLRRGRRAEGDKPRAPIHLPYIPPRICVTRAAFRELADRCEPATDGNARPTKSEC